ncbi:cytochrome oxidase c assembly-domain-containing protein [Thermothelomyces heterothallicus CBS 202.75]|uniref:cytochrome oxidase c assembly-domain-containing protein n=1 Tax=Thermothelomyces heterothallicus CBS 202.75 TaxID=1149848 RepID=UPI003743E9DF
MKPTVRLSAAPRSVSDATRFTATTLHASSKAAAPPPRFAPPKSGSGNIAPGAGAGGKGGPIHETPEQKVARLRAAHLRAKAAQTSRLDRFIAASSRVFDSAHKITVAGLIGFTVIAGLATAYTAVDMLTFNKRRNAEWIERQKKLEADSLEAARIAYMTGKATEEQIKLVEEQLERERQSGRKTSFFSDLSVLSTPEPADATVNPSSFSSSSSSSSSPAQTSPQSTTTILPQPGSVTERVSWPPKDGALPADQENQDQHQERKSSGIWSWLTSNLKREEADEPLSSSSPPPSTPRLGYESLSPDDENGVRDSDIVRAVESKQAALKAKAQAALDKERENQRSGGPLDRVGTQEGETGVARDGEQLTGDKRKKSWFW